MTAHEQISSLLASVKRPKKKKRPYKKPDALKQLENMAYLNHYEGRNIPEYAKVKEKFRDDTANGLTKAIVKYITLAGGYATRLNSTGIYRADIKKFVPNTQKRGLGDVLATFKGFSIMVEVKIGRDRINASQLKFKAEFEKSGGHYFVAKNFESFKYWFDQIIKNNKKIQ